MAIKTKINRFHGILVNKEGKWFLKDIATSKEIDLAELFKDLINMNITIQYTERFIE